MVRGGWLDVLILFGCFVVVVLYPRLIDLSVEGVYLFGQVH
jgi:hypothetical protein